MVVTDEDALICDMAETYHVYDMESLPISFVSTLAAGLRPDSRIRSKMAGVETHLNIEYLLAYCVDNIILIRKMLGDSSDMPELFTDRMLVAQKPKEWVLFDSGADFTREWNKLTRI